MKAENCIDEFIYEGVDVVLEADQTIEDIEIDGITELINYKNLTIQKVNEITSLTVNGDIRNEVGASIIVDSSSVILDGKLHNDGTLTLKDATITMTGRGSVENAYVMTTEGQTFVTRITNANNCINCGEDKALLTVVDGKLTTNMLLNHDKVVVNEDAALEANVMTNFGTMDISGEATFVDGKNYSTMTIEATGSVWEDYDPQQTSNVLCNYNGAVINVKGSLTENIKNAGEIFVIENGIVIVNGKPTGDTGLNGIIDISEANAGAPAQAARDMGGVNHNYFRYTVGTETTATALQEALKLRISSDNWGTAKNPIILVWGENSATSFAGTMTEANVERIIIENDLVIEAKEGTNVVVTKFGELNDNDWSNPANSPSAAVNKALWVKEGASLYVNAYATLELVEGAAGAQEPLHVQVDGTFKANDQSLVKGTTVVVDGDSTGKVYVGNDPATFEWNKGTFAGKWSGIE